MTYIHDSPPQSTEADSVAMSIPTTHPDLEAPHSLPREEGEKVDIEHAYVADDPRKWSPTKKVR